MKTQTNSPLVRMGSKRKLVSKLLPLFPSHSIFIDLFCATNSIFFAKQKSKYNILNDYDHQVYNLWRCLQDPKIAEELLQKFNNLPICQKLFNDHKGNFADKNYTLPSADKAVLFLFFQNYGYHAQAQTMKTTAVSNTKNLTMENLKNAIVDLGLNDVTITGDDFRKVLKNVNFHDPILDKQKTFIFADPPYLHTSNNYVCEKKWDCFDTIDLFTELVDYNCNFAICEFNSPEIIDLAKKFNLKVNYICERQNLENRRVEILITNYETNKVLF